MPESLIEIVARCRLRDEAAIDELVHRFHGWARDLAVSILDTPSLADDVVQEAFCASVEGLATLRSPQAFVPWFRQIIRRTAMRLNRREREAPLPETGEWPDSRPNCDQTMTSRELRDSVRKAVRSLPDRTREAVEMYYFEERSCREVAELLGVPNGTVRRRLHDGRQRLRDLLLHVREDAPKTSGRVEPPL